MLDGSSRKGRIKVKKILIFIFLLSLCFGFAGCGSYGKLRLQSGPGEAMTIQQLKENWEKYNVLGTGVEPNVPSAIIFDRKDDGRDIIGDRWWEIKDDKSVSGTIDMIAGQVTGARFFPRLWKMLGPDDHLYGYMFTAWDHAVMTIGDDKTMTVMDIPEPPFLAVGGNGKGREP
jgi:hypothetical protein